MRGDHARFAKILDDPFQSQNMRSESKAMQLPIPKIERTKRRKPFAGNLLPRLLRLIPGRYNRSTTRHYRDRSNTFQSQTQRPQHQGKDKQAMVVETKAKEQ